MQQAIQAYWKDGCIELTMGEVQKNAHRLSPQQARALACELIQRAYQAQTNAVLKQQKEDRK